MKKDGEIFVYLEARRKGATQIAAAARAGISERTARTYERAALLPSQRKAPRTYRTRPDPFRDGWPWVVEQLERDSDLEAKTIFEELQRREPEVYDDGQLRTLQRRIHDWRTRYGPDREVIFEQVYPPAHMMQSDFTSMTALKITLAGQPFPHLLYHAVLPYSRYEIVRVCFSESLEAFSEGLEFALARFGGVPKEHRTDNLSAAVRTLDRDDPFRFTEAYLAMLKHYDMRASTNVPGRAHENGAVEQAHHRFKETIDQTLHLRGNRDFPNRQAYESFLEENLRRRNRRRQPTFEQERQALRPLPTTRLDYARKLRVRVTRFSIVRILNNRYSVPSRLIGEMLTATLHAETIELSHGTTPVLTVPRLRGRDLHLIDYRHVAWSLARKPGAFAQYRFREELFPTTTFRRAYDVLVERLSAKADQQYVRILHRAASVSESAVEAALSLLLESEITPTFDEVRALTEPIQISIVPEMVKPSVELRSYDRLLAGATA
jgi:transposase